MKKINPRFPDYDVHDDGRVFRARYSKPTGKGTRSSHLGSEIKGRVLLSGYRQFNLVQANGERALVRANRLIAETFIGPAPTARHHCAHGDGDRLNNHIGNLRWATAKENNADQNLHGTRRRGNRTLTNEEIQNIRFSYSGRRGHLVEMSRTLGIPKTTLARVIKGYGPRALDGRR